MIKFLVNYAKRSHEKAFTAFRVKGMRGRFNSAVFVPTYVRMTAGKDKQKRSVKDENDMMVSVYFNQIRLEANQILVAKAEKYSWAATIAACALAFMAVPMLWGAHEPTRPIHETIRVIVSQKAQVLTQEGGLKQAIDELAGVIQGAFTSNPKRPDSAPKEVSKPGGTNIEAAKEVNVEQSKQEQKLGDFDAHRSALGTF